MTKPGAFGLTSFWQIEATEEYKQNDSGSIWRRRNKRLNKSYRALLR